MNINNIHHVTQESYPYPVFIDRYGTVAKNVKVVTKKVLQIYGKKCDYQLICTGTSGAVIAYEMQRLLRDSLERGYDVDVFYVRKANETNHHGESGVKLQKETTMIIVDDRVASGQTLRNIAKYLRDYVTGNFAEQITCVCARGCEPENVELLFPNIKNIIR